MQEIIHKWLNSNKVRQEYKDFINNASTEHLDSLFSSRKFVFGTAGYRALISPGFITYNDITFEQLAIAYARYIRSKVKNDDEIVTVAIATDNRLDHKRNANIFKAVFNNFNIKTLYYKNDLPFPTPILSYVIKNTNCVGGVNITASHNPKTYNGIKFYNNQGSQLLPNEDEVLINLIPDQEIVLDGPVYEIKDDFNSIIDDNLIQQYFLDIKTSFNVKINTTFKEKILFSGMHGTAIPFMKEFLNSLGYDCVNYEPHNFYSDEFINAKCINPEVIEAFVDLIKYADEHNIKYIFATDPDADRLGICYKKDDKWLLLNGNQAGIIETDYLLDVKNYENKTPVSISTYVSNTLIDRILEAKNGIVLRTATGFKHLANEIIKLDANHCFISAFEEAIGALLSSINLDKDSFQVAIVLLQVLSKYASLNYDFTDILEKVIFPKYGHWYGNTFCQIISGIDWKEKAKSYIKLLSEYHHPKILSRTIKSISYNEKGSCLEFELDNNSWIKFRLSGTEPKFKIYFNLFNDDNSIPNDEISFHLENEAIDILEFICQYLGLERV